MARVDPCLLELYELIKTDELLNDFLRQNHLISKPPALGMTAGQNSKPFIAFCSTKPFNARKPNCTGVITEVLKKDLPKFRCTVCKSEVSAHHGAAAYDPAAVQGHMSFFNTVDAKYRPNRKVFRFTLSFANLLAVG